MAHLFLSYSAVDGLDAALLLAEGLTAGPPSVPVWFDRYNLHPGSEDWDDQIDEALRTCRAVLFVMTADSLGTTSVCKDEWTQALAYKKPVIPLRFDIDAVLPFRLGSRQFVDFTGGLEAALARLRQHLRWLDSPEGTLSELRVRLADARRQLNRVTQDRRPRIEADIAALEQRIADQELAVNDPDGASASTEQRIAAGIAREQQPAEPVTVTVRATKFVNAPPMVAPSWFQDRQMETELMGRFVADEGLRLFTVAGRGGVGKTAMVCRLLRALEAGRLPDDGEALSLTGIVYLAKAGRHRVSFANFYDDLCSLCGPDQADRLRAVYRDPQQSPSSKMTAVLEPFPSSPSPVVVLLDNFEDLVDPVSETIVDRELAKAVEALLRGPAHGVKVIITTRVTPRDLGLVEPGRQRRLRLDDGLEPPFAKQVLRDLDVDGSLGMRDASDELLDRAHELTRGYPRALEALKAILVADGTATLAEVLAQELAPDNVVEAFVGEAFSRLDPLAQQVMEALAVYAAPVPAVAVDYLLQPYQPAINSSPVLRRLVNAQFVRGDHGRFHLHPVDRTYALSRLPDDPVDDQPGVAGFSRRALLDRAAEYFAQTRTPRETWRTLDDLGAQLAEFDLRCQAGDYDIAADIVAEIGGDYLLRWGHVRLLIDLRRRLDGRLDDPWSQATHFGDLGTCYWTLGDHRRAIDLHEQALAIARETGDRRGEGIHLGNLGLCHNALGDHRRAIDLHEQALAIARETGDRGGEGTTLGNLGVCHNALGDHRRAIDLHEQALAIARTVGDRQNEGIHLGNLGVCHEATTGVPSISTSRPWPSPGRSVTAGRRGSALPHSGYATRRLETTGEPSCSSRRRWGSPGPSATVLPKRASSAAWRPPAGQNEPGPRPPSSSERR